MKRIKYPLLLLVIMSMTIMAHSQKIGGIRVGYQASNIYENGATQPGTTNFSSFYVGFSKYKDIIPLLDFGSGLEYFQNGSQIDSDNKLVLHYLSVPVNLRLKIGPVFALAGVAPSVKVSETWFVAGEKIKPGDDTKANWFDYPVFVGAGFKVLMFSIDARYHWGMNELHDGDGTKSQYFQLGAGISF